MEKNLNMEMDKPIKITSSFWHAFNLIQAKDPLKDEGGGFLDFGINIIKENDTYKILDKNNQELVSLPKNTETFLLAFRETERILGLKMFF